MKKILPGIVILALFAASCNKNDDPTPVSPDPDPYMTLTSGSSWVYLLTDLEAGGATSTYNLVSTNRDTMLQGNLVFHVFDKSTGNKEYYNITDNKYIVYRKLHPLLGDYTKFVRYLDLTNNSWSEDFNVVVNGMPQTLNLKDTVLERNVSRVVNGTTYTKVICVKTDYSYPSISPNYFQGYVKSYYAPKYGLIEDSTRFVLLPNVSGFTLKATETTKLMSADLH